MQKLSSSPSVALVYDRINTPYGGAENVLLALHRAFPQAPLYTSIYEPKIAGWALQFPIIHTSFLNQLPVLRRFHRWLAWLMPLAFESFDLSTYDIIISVTSAEAKGILTKPNQFHLCYLLTPPRYLYQHQAHSLDSHWLLRLPVIRQVAQFFLAYLHHWDQTAIFRPDVIIPISQQVADRVRRFYPGVKPAPVIYPPINMPIDSSSTQEPVNLPKEYFLVVSRLVSYKRVELALQACLQLGKNLVIVGQGPEKNKLKKLAKPGLASGQITFIEAVSRPQLATLYANCQAVLMPGEEDFGIVALEANSFGKPVIINAQSGAAELIQPGIHGLHLKKETQPAMTKALQQFEQTVFSPSKIAQNPLQYAADHFVRAFAQTTQTLWKTHQKQNHD